MRSGKHGIGTGGLRILIRVYQAVVWSRMCKWSGGSGVVAAPLSLVIIVALLQDLVLLSQILVEVGQAGLVCRLIIAIGDLVLVLMQGGV